jgi:hypothetical protein
MGLFEIVAITFILELTEFYLQYSKSLREMIFRLYGLYQKSPFLLFLIHINYIWLLSLSVIYSNTSWALIVAISLKVFNIFVKIELIRKVFIENQDEELNLMIERAPASSIYLLDTLIYPFLVYIAFS